VQARTEERGVEARAVSVRREAAKMIVVMRGEQRVCAEWRAILAVR